MKKFRNIPIKQKLVIIIVGLSAFMLAGGFSLVIVEKYFSYRIALVRNIGMLADALGKNSTAAIVFDDPVTAMEILSALKVEPGVTAATFQTNDGEVFAYYLNQTENHFDIHEYAQSSYEIFIKNSYGYRFHPVYLDLVRPIVLDKKTIGLITIRTDLRNLYQSLILFILIAFLGVSILAFIAFVLASRLQALISEPIAHLAEIIDMVSRDKNYDARATKTSEDELGVLIDGFNEMLEQIRDREQNLEMP